MIDWIQGEKFIGLADYKYSPKSKSTDDYDNLQNTLNLHRVKNCDIIYTHLMYVKQLFEILNLISGRVIVVSHNGDNRIDDFFEIPNSVEKWYTQNVNVKNPKVESIPIGLENNRWSIRLMKKEKMETKLLIPKTLKNLVYMCHNTKTNYIERIKPYKILGEKSWVTSETNSSFDQYLNNLYNHKFMICPEGNGLDTHRMWECLYMGTIPIEKRNINNQYYTDLPISFVDDWEEVTVDFLAKELERIQSGTWNMEKLTFEYWKNKIRGN